MLYIIFSLIYCFIYKYYLLGLLVFLVIILQVHITLLDSQQLNMNTNFFFSLHNCNHVHIHYSSKVVGLYDVLRFLKEYSYTHKGCIYYSKNSNKKLITKYYYYNSITI